MRRYVAYWSARAFHTENGSDRLEILAGEYFSDDRGYDEADRAAITELEVGKTWVSPDYGRYHWLTRIEDNVSG